MKMRRAVAPFAAETPVFACIRSSAQAKVAVGIAATVKDKGLSIRDTGPGLAGASHTGARSTRPSLASDRSISLAPLDLVPDLKREGALFAHHGSSPRLVTCGLMAL